MPLQTMQSGSDTTDLVNILNLVKGQTTTSATTTSQAGQQALLNQILASTQGLAQTAAGQGASGIYSSTVNQQSVNDLLARSTADVAAKNATTTTTKQPQIGGKDLLTMLGSFAASKVLGPTMKGVSSKLGLDDLGNQLAAKLGLGPAPLSKEASSSAYTDAADTAGGLNPAVNPDVSSLMGSTDLTGSTTGMAGADLAGGTAADLAGGTAADLTGADLMGGIGATADTVGATAVGADVATAGAEAVGGDAAAAAGTDVLGDFIAALGFL